MVRNNSKRKRAVKSTVPVISVIVDGETEVWYLQLMKHFEGLKNIDIKPELPKKRGLSDLFQLVQSYASDYSEVYWIIDLDTIIKETNEKQKGAKSKLDELKGYVTKLQHYKNVQVLINTPCLEFWLLLHLKESGRFYDRCDMVCDELRKYDLLVDYEKSEKYYKKSSNDIYSKLKKVQCIAFSNAEKLGNFDFNNPKTAKAEIYKLIEILLQSKNKIIINKLSNR